MKPLALALFLLASYAAAQKAAPLPDISSDGSTITHNHPANQWCLFQTLDTTSGIATNECFGISDWSAGPGFSYGNGAIQTQQGWRTSATLPIRKYAWSRGINQAVVINQTDNAIGDSAALYIYHYGKGGYTAPSDEGIEPLKIDGGQSPFVYAGKLLSRNRDSLTITASQDAQNPLDGGYLLDLATPVCAGHITAEDERSFTLTTAEACPVSSAVGVTTSAISIKPNSQTLVTTRFSVRTSTGTFIPGLITLACPDYLDPAYAVDVQPVAGGVEITAALRYSHAAGCQVFQGGAHGALDLHADRRKPVGQLMRTSYQIVGATDAHTLVYRHYVQGSLQGLPAGAHNFGIALPFWLHQRSGGMVTACLQAYSLRGALVFFEGQPIAVQADAHPFSGTFKASLTPDPGCLTWRQSGPDTGNLSGTSNKAMIVTGGKVGDLGEFTLWPSAEVNTIYLASSTDSAGKRTVQFSGQLHLAPNDVSWKIGDSLEEPAHPSVTIQMFGLDGAFNSPSTHSGNKSMDIAAHGVGVDSGYIGIDLHNDNPAAMYLGAGGHTRPPTLLSIRGPYADNHIDPPLRGGSVWHIDQTKDRCADPTQDVYNLFAADWHSSTAYWQFNCAKESSTLEIGGHGYTFDKNGLTTDSLNLTSGGHTYRLTIVNGAPAFKQIN